MKQSSQFNQKNNFQLFNKGVRIFVLIVYLLYFVGAPTIAVHAAGKDSAQESFSVQSEEIQPQKNTGGEYEYYLPIIMGGSGTLPEDIILSSNSIDENMPVDTVVGTLTTLDPGVGDTFTYSLVAGEGDTDNDSFNISGDQLRSSEIFNYEEKSSYSIRIQTMDQVGLKYQESFIIEVLDVDDPPVAIDQTVSTMQNEQVSITLTGSDEDGDPLTYWLLALPDYGTLYEDGQIVTIPQPGGSVPISPDLVYDPDDGFTGEDAFTFQVLANDVLSNVATVTINVDGTAPTLNITGAIADGEAMDGDLETGFILETTNDPAIDHLVQFADGTDTNEPLADEYFGLYLVDSTVSADDLKDYYVAHGTPSAPIDFLGYLQDAVDGSNPFVYIKGKTVRLVDAAKWDLLTEEHDMTVPDDFPLGTYTVEGEIEDEAGNPTTVTLKLIVEDLTQPTLESVTPLEGDFVVCPGGTFVWVVDAADSRGNLYELEVDHSMESNPATPEFSVYASETDPYGGEGAQFAAAGVTVTYDAVEEMWTIDFGQSITNLFIANGGITFYVVLKDDAGNVWGSMDPTTDENTFIYTIPAATMESTDEYEVYQGVVYKKYQMMFGGSQIPLSDTNLRSLWVKEPGDADYTSIPLDDEPLLWFDVENPAGTYEYIAVTLAGEAYSASLAWPEQQTASFEPTGNIGESDGLFYQEYVLMDGETQISLAGEDLEIFAQKIGDAWILMSGPNLGETLWISMNKPIGTYEYLVITQSDVVYLATLVIEEDDTSPILEGVTPPEGEVVLPVGAPFVLTVDGSDRHLFELEIDHSMEATLPEFSVYANDGDPYGGQYDQFATLGVTVTYNAAEQRWTIDFGQTITDLFIAEGGITFYIVLKDFAGNTWGSMDPTTPENTFEYTITQAGI